MCPDSPFDRQHGGRRLLFGLLAVVGVVGTQLGLGPTTLEPGQAFECVSRPSELRELGFSLRGTIREILAKPGDAVRAGDRLVGLDDRVQQATVELARLQADDTSKVRQAQASLVYREEELRLVEATTTASAANPADLREARYRRDSAVIELESARQQAKADQVMLLREQARLNEMSIASPIDATVLEVQKRAGETVDQGTTVVTLISVDPLWLDVNVPTRLAVAVEVGQKALVTWQDVEGVAPMPGTVIFKSPAAHAGARQVQMRVEVPNPKKIPGGLHGTVVFETGPRAPSGEGVTRQ